MGCNCGKSTRIKKSARRKIPQKKVESTMPKDNTDITDEMVEQAFAKLQEGWLIPKSIKEFGWKVRPGMFRQKMEEKYGQEFVQTTTLSARFSQVAKNICNREDKELINSSIAVCEDILVRLSQKQAELGK